MSVAYLIRHPMTAMDPGRPPAEWLLSNDGRRQLDRLLTAPWWPAVQQVYTSTEPKSVAVGEAVVARYGCPASAHGDLDEVHRAEFVPDYGRVVRRAFAAPDLPANGWEPLSSARDRTIRFVRDVVANGQLPAAVVSHGLVLNELRASLLGEPRGAFEAWRALPFAAVAVADLRSWELVSDFA